MLICKIIVLLYFAKSKSYWYTPLSVYVLDCSNWCRTKTSLRTIKTQTRELKFYCYSKCEKQRKNCRKFLGQLFRFWIVIGIEIQQKNFIIPYGMTQSAYTACGVIDLLEN